MSSTPTLHLLTLQEFLSPRVRLSSIPSRTMPQRGCSSLCMFHRLTANAFCVLLETLPSVIGGMDVLKHILLNCFYFDIVSCVVTGPYMGPCSVTNSKTVYNITSKLYITSLLIPGNIKYVYSMECKTIQICLKI